VRREVDVHDFASVAVENGEEVLRGTPLQYCGVVVSTISITDCYVHVPLGAHTDLNLAKIVHTTNTVAGVGFGGTDRRIFMAGLSIQ
jgi:hypothetical protein